MTYQRAAHRHDVNWSQELNRSSDEKCIFRLSTSVTRKKSDTYCTLLFFATPLPIRAQKFGLAYMYYSLTCVYMVEIAPLCLVYRFPARAYLGLLGHAGWMFIFSAVWVWNVIVHLFFIHWLYMEIFISQFCGSLWFVIGLKKCLLTVWSIPIKINQQLYVNALWALGMDQLVCESLARNNLIFLQYYTVYWCVIHLVAFIDITGKSMHRRWKRERQGDMSPLKFSVRGWPPLKFWGGRKIGEKNKEKERKIQTFFVPAPLKIFELPRPLNQWQCWGWGMAVAF